VRRPLGLVGRLHAARDGRGKPQKIFRVPSIENFGAGLERAVSEDCIVDRAARQTGLGASYRRSKVLVCLETDERQLLSDIAQEQKRLVSAYPSRRRHAGQDGIDLGQTVRAAASVVSSEA